MNVPIRVGLLSWLLSGVILLAGPSAVDDALSHALDAAEAFAEKGDYKVRKDYWEGRVASQKRSAVKHQLIKGNSYWFWLGTESEDATLGIRVLDKKGKAYEVETLKDKQWQAVRIEVPKTGSYYIVFEIATKDKSEANWAIAYAYK